METRLETLLLRTRWMLLPLYLALLLCVLAIYVLIGREMLHLVADIMTMTEGEVVLLILGVLDLVLVANLIVMVAISSYESFLSRIETSGAKPEWLGKLDAGGVKVKVAVSIVLISAIYMLRVFLLQPEWERMTVLGGGHLVFIVTTIALVYVERKHD